AAPAPRGVDSGSLLLQRDLEGSRRRLLGRLFRGLDSRATRLWRRIADDDERQRNLLSHAGRSNGTFWLAIPHARWMQAGSAIWHIAFLRRLGVACAPPGATCRLRCAAAVEDAGVEVQECGEALGRRAAHVLPCPWSATRLRAHTGAVRGLEEELRSAGAVVDLERRVPELRAERWWLDVNVRSPFNASLADAGRVPGAAAAAGDQAKASRYGEQVHSIAVEAGGRLRAGAAAALAELAAASQAHGRLQRTGRRGTTPHGAALNHAWFLTKGTMPMGAGPKAELERVVERQLQQMG
ncbi:unnamed protein product, partial [Prorocentrum cordatum]